MLVHELISKLEKFSPDLKVIVRTDTLDLLGIEEVSIEYLYKELELDGFDFTKHEVERDLNGTVVLTSVSD